jgi:TIR domain
VESKQDNAKSTALARRNAMRLAAHGLAWAAAEVGNAPRDPLQDAKAAQVFISYSQDERAIAQSLAAFLAQNGIASWWDREILSGEDFTCAIETALRAAVAAIVIWSDTSVSKEYVRNEATYARNRGKLITVHVPAFDKEKIPIGFILRQSECVEDRPRLMQALARFGIVPRAPNAGDAS